MALDRNAARAYARRWGVLRAVARAELRAASVGAKARQLAALMASAHLFGRRRHAGEDAAARRRWVELQRRFRAEA